jgi:hypothetical protein
MRARKKVTFHLAELAVKTLAAAKSERDASVSQSPARHISSRLGTELPLFSRYVRCFPEIARKKVTFIGSTTRTKVTFDPEKGDLRRASSRERVTMYPEKGDFLVYTLGFEDTRKKVTFFLCFQRFSEGNSIFHVSADMPGET